MSALINIAGQRFGKLVALMLVSRNAKGEAMWSCKCDCGNTHTARSGYLRKGTVTSCGCNKTPHGMTMSPEWRCWREMLARCYNANNDRYADYGGRGIVVCGSWRSSFPAFLADMETRPEGMTVDRLDSDGPYCKDNCRWATRSEQQRNRRDSASWSIRGVVYETAGDAARALNVP